MSTSEKRKIPTELLEIATVCGDISPEVLGTAYARYQKNKDEPWGKTGGSVNYRGITVPSRFLTELADCCFRWGLSDQLAEILAGPWGFSIISAMAYNSQGKSPKKQGATEKRMAGHGKGGENGVGMRVKSRYIFRDLRGEIDSIMGIVYGILWGAQKDWVTGFPTRVVKTHEAHIEGFSYRLDYTPTLFEAFFPLGGETALFCANLTDEQRDGLQVVCSTNRQENPDLRQPMSWRARPDRELSEKHWGVGNVRYVRSTKANSFGGSIIQGKLRENIVHSAICSAVYGYIQHEYGNLSRITSTSPDSWENTDLWENYSPYTASNFVEECPMEVLQYLENSGRVKRTALKIVRALQARNEDDAARRKNFSLMDVLSAINATRGEGEKEMADSTFYDAWDTLVQTAKKIMAEEVVKEEMSFGWGAKKALS
jgi:hypothetical protein